MIKSKEMAKLEVGCVPHTATSLFDTSINIKVDGTTNNRLNADSMRANALVRQTTNEDHLQLLATVGSLASLTAPGEEEKITDDISTVTVETIDRAKCKDSRQHISSSSLVEDGTPVVVDKATPKLHHEFYQQANQVEYTNGIDQSFRWMEMYHCLLSYKAQHNGSTNVPLEIVPLGPWVRLQRIHRSRGTLPIEKASLLESIGFDWKHSLDEKWMDMFQRLVAYKAKHNSTRVPKRYKPDPQLGIWVRYQRRSCKDKDRVHLLNAIGFQWDGRVDTWMAMYQRLVAYKAKHKTTFVPERCQEDPPLGLWVHHQRAACKDEHRIQLLNAIGFHWDARTDSWMELYERLVAYKNKYGTTRVPRQFQDDPQLGLWVFTQRQCCKENYRVGLLNDIGFEWNARDDGWKEMYRRLVAFKTKYKTANVRQSYKEDPKLARWVHNQRRCCKDPERIRLLDAIGFQWGLGRSDGWMEMYRQLAAYAEEHQTTHVPHSSQRLSRLARWVYYQRRSCKDQKRIDLLNAIGFEWKSPRSGGR